MRASTREKTIVRDKGLSAKPCVSIACGWMSALQAGQGGAQQSELQPGRTTSFVGAGWWPTNVIIVMVTKATTELTAPRRWLPWGRCPPFLYNK
jgi:hypothetical protein